MSLIKIFYDPRNALSAPDTGRDDAVFLSKPLHVMDQLYGQLAAGAAQRMSKRDSSAVDIDNVGVQFQPPDNSQSLRGKGFIQLDEIDLAQVHTGLP